jgi:hypothetical protein
VIKCLRRGKVGSILREDVGNQPFLVSTMSRLSWLLRQGRSILSSSSVGVGCIDCGDVSGRPSFYVCFLRVWVGVSSLRSL